MVMIIFISENYLKSVGFKKQMAKSLFLQYIFNEADLKKDCSYLHPLVAYIL